MTAHTPGRNLGWHGPPAIRTAASWLERKRRPCLRCGKAFLSAHAGNRVCGRCHGSDAADWIDRRGKGGE